VTRRASGGAAVIAAGLFVAGLCIYAFLSLSARDVGPDRYATVAVLWAVVFLAGPGLFTPLEQETARAIVARRQQHVGPRPVVLRSAALGAGVAVMLAIVTLVVARRLADGLFHGNTTCVVAFALSLPGYAAMHVSRGTLIGLGRFHACATLIAGESVLRLIGAGIVVVGGYGVTGYALVIGAAPLGAVAVLWLVARPALHDGPPHPWRALSGALGALLAASAFSTALLNAGPIVTRLAVKDERVVSALFAGLLLVRPPLYLWQGFTSALLPALTHAAEAGRRHEVRMALSRVGIAVCGLAVLSAAVVLAVGPLLGRLLYGEGFELGRGDLLLLELATCAFMLAQATGQGLIALRRAGWVAWAWGVGLLALVGVALARPGSPEVVEAALLVGCTLAAAAMCWPFVRMGAPPVVAPGD
jgi:O-antigen/teichoic acid export membrane protein